MQMEQVSSLSPLKLETTDTSMFDTTVGESGFLGVSFATTPGGAGGLGTAGGGSSLRTLRQRVRASVVAGISGGALQKALLCEQQHASSSSSAPCGPVPASSAQRLQLRTREAVAAGVGNGGLRQALRQNWPADVEVVGADPGKTQDSVLVPKKEPSRSELLRRRARESIASGVAQQTLQLALAQERPSSSASLRRTHKRDLEEVLQPPVAKEEERAPATADDHQQRLRMRVRESVAQGIAGGSLSRCLGTPADTQGQAAENEARVEAEGAEAKPGAAAAAEEVEKPEADATATRPEAVVPGVRDSVGRAEELRLHAQQSIASAVRERSLEPMLSIAQQQQQQQQPTSANAHTSDCKPLRRLRARVRESVACGVCDRSLAPMLMIAQQPRPTSSGSQPTQEQLPRQLPGRVTNSAVRRLRDGQQAQARPGSAVEAQEELGWSTDPNVRQHVREPAEPGAYSQQPRPSSAVEAQQVGWSSTRPSTAETQGGAGDRRPSLQHQLQQQYQPQQQQTALGPWPWPSEEPAVVRSGSEQQVRRSSSWLRSPTNGEWNTQEERAVTRFESEEVEGEAAGEVLDGALYRALVDARRDSLSSSSSALLHRPPTRNQASKPAPDLTVHGLRELQNEAPLGHYASQQQPTNGGGSSRRGRSPPAQQQEAYAEHDSRPSTGSSRRARRPSQEANARPAASPRLRERELQAREAVSSVGNERGREQSPPKPAHKDEEMPLAAEWQEPQWQPAFYEDADWREDVEVQPAYRREPSEETIRALNQLGASADGGEVEQILNGGLYNSLVAARRDSPDESSDGTPRPRRQRQGQQHYASRRHHSRDDEWFAASREAQRSSPERHRYVSRDEPPNDADEKVAEARRSSPQQRSSREEVPEAGDELAVEEDANHYAAQEGEPAPAARPSEEQDDTSPATQSQSALGDQQEPTQQTQQQQLQQQKQEEPEVQVWAQRPEPAEEEAAHPPQQWVQAEERAVWRTEEPEESHSAWDQPVASEEEEDGEETRLLFTQLGSGTGGPDVEHILNGGLYNTLVELRRNSLGTSNGSTPRPALQRNPAAHVTQQPGPAHHVTRQRSRREEQARVVQQPEPVARVDRQRSTREAQAEARSVQQPEPAPAPTPQPDEQGSRSGDQVQPARQPEPAPLEPASMHHDQSRPEPKALVAAPLVEASVANPLGESTEYQDNSFSYSSSLFEVTPAAQATDDSARAMDFGDGAAPLGATRYEWVSQDSLVDPSCMASLDEAASHLQDLCALLKDSLSDEPYGVQGGGPPASSATPPTQARGNSKTAPPPALPSAPAHREGNQTVQKSVARPRGADNQRGHVAAQKSAARPSGADAVQGREASLRKHARETIAAAVRERALGPALAPTHGLGRGRSGLAEGRPSSASLREDPAPARRETGGKTKPVEAQQAGGIAVGGPTGRDRPAASPVVAHATTEEPAASQVAAPLAAAQSAVNSVNTVLESHLGVQSQSDPAHAPQSDLRRMQRWETDASAHEGQSLLPEQQRLALGHAADYLELLSRELRQAMGGTPRENARSARSESEPEAPVPEPAPQVEALKQTAPAAEARTELPRHQPQPPSLAAEATAKQLPEPKQQVGKQAHPPAPVAPTPAEPPQRPAPVAKDDQPPQPPRPPVPAQQQQEEPPVAAKSLRKEEEPPAAAKSVRKEEEARVPEKSALPQRDVATPPQPSGAGPTTTASGHPVKNAVSSQERAALDKAAEQLQQLASQLREAISSNTTPITSDRPTASREQAARVSGAVAVPSSQPQQQPRARGEERPRGTQAQPRQSLTRAQALRQRLRCSVAKSIASGDLQHALATEKQRGPEAVPQQQQQQQPPKQRQPSPPEPEQRKQEAPAETAWKSTQKLGPQRRSSPEALQKGQDGGAQAALKAHVRATLAKAITVSQLQPALTKSQARRSQETGGAREQSKPQSQHLDVGREVARERYVEPQQQRPRSQEARQAARNAQEQGVRTALTQAASELQQLAQLFRQGSLPLDGSPVLGELTSSGGGFAEVQPARSQAPAWQRPTSEERKAAAEASAQARTRTAEGRRPVGETRRAEGGKSPGKAEEHRAASPSRRAHRARSNERSATDGKKPQRNGPEDKALGVRARARELFKMAVREGPLQETLEKVGLQHERIDQVRRERERYRQRADVTRKMEARKNVAIVDGGIGGPCEGTPRVVKSALVARAGPVGCDPAALGKQALDVLAKAIWDGRIKPPLRSSGLGPMFDELGPDLLSDEEASVDSDTEGVPRPRKANVVAVRPYSAQSAASRAQSDRFTPREGKLASWLDLTDNDPESSRLAQASEKTVDSLKSREQGESELPSTPDRSLSPSLAEASVSHATLGGPSAGTSVRRRDSSGYPRHAEPQMPLAIAQGHEQANVHQQPRVAGGDTVSGSGRRGEVQTSGKAAKPLRMRPKTPTMEVRSPVMKEVVHSRSECLLRRQTHAIDTQGLEDGLGAASPTRQTHFVPAAPAGAAVHAVRWLHPHVREPGPVSPARGARATTPPSPVSKPPHCW